MLSDDQNRRTRAPNHTGTSHHRKDGRWEWKVTLPNGKRKSYYGATEREAREKARRALRDLEDGLSLDAATMTVATFLDMWIEIVATQRVRATSLETYRGHITNHIIPAIGRVKLVSLRAPHVDTMMAGIVEDRLVAGKKVRGASPATANRVRATLRNALGSAVRWRYVNHNAAAHAEPRKEKRERIQPLTPEQMATFLEFTADHRHGPIYMFAAYTGLRAGELLALRWHDLDLDDETMHVRHSLTRRDYGSGRLNDPKTPESRRSLKLSDAAIEALDRQRVLIDQWRALAAERWVDHDLVFPNTVGGYSDNSRITQTLKALLADAKLPRQRLHDFRHYYASTLIAEGAGIQDVSAMLGHTNIAMTWNVYGHLTRKLSEDAAKRIDNSRKRGEDPALTTIPDDKRGDTP